MTVAGQTVTVTQNAGFANATLTTVQAVDFNELRTRIDALRSALSLSAVSYTNTVVAGGTIEAVDVTEMRAGSVIRARGGRTTPTSAARGARRRSRRLPGPDPVGGHEAGPR